MWGLELMMKSRSCSPCPLYAVMSAFSFSVAIAVGGTLIAAWICPLCSAATIASSFEKYCRPNPSIAGFGP